MSKINETNYPRRPQSDYEDTDMLIIQEAGGNTYTTRIEDIREDCQEAIAPIVEAVNDALAPPENGSTASQSYAIGEHFMRNGDFCTAIAAITSGASFTLNTNYVVGTIAEALESLNSELTNYDIDTSGSLNMFKNNSHVAIYGKVENLDSSATTVVYSTLATKYRPKAEYAICPLLSTTLPYTPIGTVWISRNTGNIAIYKGNQTAGYIYADYLC